MSNNRRRALLGVALAVVAVAAAEPVSGRRRLAYDVTKDVAVPMRDGVILRADIYLPTASAPFPTLVYRTPYGKGDETYPMIQQALTRGYALVVQDVRGRYASAGDFNPYKQEPADGYDTIEWAAQQSWSNGSVGMFGLSYPAAVQWLAAIETPPHLKAIVPAMTFSTPRNFFYGGGDKGGAWDMSWIEWIWDNIAPDARVKKHLSGPTTDSAALKAWDTVRPRADREVPLDSLVELQGLAPFYYEWLSHPPEDPWWEWGELRDKYAKVHAAVLNFSGWYDDNYGPEGATTNFAGLLRARAVEGERDPRTHLVLGAWVHGGQGDTVAGERSFGRTSAIQYDSVVLRWLDHYVRGLDNGVDREPKVRYFVMGANQWRSADTWPPAATRVSYYLVGTDRMQKNRNASPSLSTDSAQAKGSSALLSDPESPVTNPYNSSGAHDYRALSERRDVLTFETAPLDHDLEVTGPIHARMYVSCNCRDLDLWVRLLDVGPTGAAYNLMSPGLDVARASYRTASHRHRPIEPDHVYELKLDDLVTSNTFLRGHRIRVQISGSFFPNFSRNPQTGEWEAVSKRMKRATITVLHRPGARSRIELPELR